MNYYKEHQTTILVAAGAVAVCIVVALAVYFGLRAVVPRQADAGPTGNNQTTPLSNAQIAQQAAAHFKAGDAALKVGDAKTGVTELKKAQVLYEKAGDVMKVEETKDQISIAEYDLTVKNDSQTTPGDAPGSTPQNTPDGTPGDTPQAPNAPNGDKSTKDR